MFPVGGLTDRLLGQDVSCTCNLHGVGRCFSSELPVERPGLAAALPKFPDSCCACEGRLAFPYCKELAACTLPLLFPIDRKDEWSLLKNCNLQGRIAMHWSAKLKNLYSSSYTKILDWHCLYCTPSCALVCP